MTYTRRPIKDPEFYEDEAMGYDEHGNRDGRAHSPCSTTGSRTDMELNTSQAYKKINLKICSRAYV